MCLENIPQVFASAAAAPAGAKGKGKVPGKVPAPPRGAMLPVHPPVTFPPVHWLGSTNAVDSSTNAEVSAGIVETLQYEDFWPWPHAAMAWTNPRKLSDGK